MLITPRTAYLMGFRYIADLALMNRIADLIGDNRFNESASELMQAWQNGAIAAQALIEREDATLQ